MIYLDSAATSPVRPEVLQAMWPYLTRDFGNPSSTHELGTTAADALADARSRVARVLGVRANEIVFTSGGTEADNLAVKGLALGDPRGRHLITVATEHEAVLGSVDYLRRLHGFAVDVLPVDGDGRVDGTQLAAALRPDTTLVSIMHANNEIGTVQPLAELSTMAAAVGAPFHTDAVQSAGWLDIRPATLGVDALTFSGHKLGAPKGIGAAWLRGRLPVEPLVHGGGQERGRRSGTEDVAGAVALATALELAEAERVARTARVTTLRDDFTARVLALVPGALATGHPAERLPATASFCFPGTNGETILLDLERRGILSSSGSACAAGRTDPSHVLLALGLDAEVASTAVRFTLDDATTAAALGATAVGVAEIVAALRPGSRSARYGT